MPLIGRNEAIICLCLNMLLVEALTAMKKNREALAAVKKNTGLPPAGLYF